MKKIIVSEGLELDVPCIKQEFGCCGPVSLKAVADYHGIKIPLRKLVALTIKDPEYGCEPEDLVNAARRIGLRRTSFSEGNTMQDIENLLERGIPPIADWYAHGYGHYSPIVGYNGHLKLMDPMKGRVITIPKEDFLANWFDYRGRFPQAENFFVGGLIVPRK